MPTKSRKSQKSSIGYAVLGPVIPSPHCKSTARRLQRPSRYGLNHRTADRSSKQMEPIPKKRAGLRNKPLDFSATGSAAARRGQSPD